MPCPQEHRLAHQLAAPDAATAAPGHLPVALSGATRRSDPFEPRPVAMLPTYCPFCGESYAALLSAPGPRCEAAS